MKIATRYDTRLQTDSIENISATLDSKLASSAPERVVDYVALSLDNLDATIARMKDAQSELKAMIAEIENQKEIIKTGTAKWLTDTGITNLKGDLVSSMKVQEAKSGEVLKITTDENSLINQGYFKTSLDKTAIKKALLSGVEIDGAELEVTHIEPSLTVYKKRR